MKIIAFKNHIVTAFSYYLILTCLGCGLLEENGGCGPNQLIASLELSPTLLSYLPEDIEHDKVYINADGLERVYSVDIDSGNLVLRNQQICSKAGNHSSRKYYDSEFKRITFTSAGDQFNVDLLFIGENEIVGWHKPYETLILYRKEDERGSRRLAIIPDSEAAQEHDEVYQNYYGELILGDRTFTKVYESKNDLGKKYYFSIGYGVIAFEVGNVLWLIKES